MKVAIAAFVTLALVVASAGWLMSRYLVPDEPDVSWWEPYAFVAGAIGLLAAFLAVLSGLVILWEWAVD